MEKPKPDRRIQRTRKALHESLVDLIIEKGFDKVTVQDVIERANVGRSTFYSHFKDTEDLFLSGFANLWLLFEDLLSGQAVEKNSVWDISLIVFQHAQGYQEVYKALVGKQSGILMAAHMHKHLSVLIRKSLKDQWRMDKQVPLDVVVYHLASSLIALLGWWVDHELPYSAEQMNRMFQQLTQAAIESIG